MKANTDGDAALAERIQREEELQPASAVVSTASQQPVVATVQAVEAEPIESHQVVVIQEPQRLPRVRTVVIDATQREASYEEPYCGPISLAVACCLVLFFWPAALFVPCCPCDVRRRTTTTYIVE